MAADPLLPGTVRVGGGSIPFRVHVPAGESPARGWPALLFAHGSGEAGRDGVRQTEVGLGPWLRREPERFPCVVVLPQLPEPDLRWLPALTAALDAVARDLPLDPDRVAVTGLSLGGEASWRLAAADPARFAAVVPICGRARVSDAPALARVPAWVFHGREDPVVPVAFSRYMVRALRHHGGDPRYTEYERGRHDVWDDAYGDPELMAWVLALGRRPAEGR